MKKNHFSKKSGEAGRIAFQGGSYSLLVTALVLALLVVLNILAGALPTSMTHYDISSSKLYSVTSNTKTVLAGLEEDVNVYWIVQSGEEDPIIENLLAKYESLSGHVKVIRKNPDVFPTFAQEYTSEPVQNNSLVVECGDRSRYIAFNDIYLAETDLNSYSYNTSFDGEGAITSAIDYVVNEEQPKIYQTEGHGERELPAAFAEQIEKANMELVPFSLLTVDAVPEEAAAVLLYAPETDFSLEEIDLLKDYARQGGKLMVVAGPTQNGTLKNLYSLLEDYGITTADGVVVEEDRGYYAFRLPYVLMPHINSHPITDPLIESRYYPIMPISQGMRIGQTPAGSTVTALLTASPTSYVKADGYQLTTYDREEGDVEGPFALAVAIDTGDEGQITWFSSSDFLEDLYNAYSSGANVDLAMNTLAGMVGESDAMAIRTKSLNYNYLTISESTSSLLKVLMIGVFPLAYLAVGAAVVWKRRRNNHEAV